MDFAPYQSSPPENNRPFSPPTATSPRVSLDYARRAFSPNATTSPPPLQHPQPQRSWQQQSSVLPYDYGYGHNSNNNTSLSPPQQGGRNATATAFGNTPTSGYYEIGNLGLGVGGLGGRGGVSEFDTSLGLRLDYEAALAYLGLPPLGAIVLLILERQSDYVRFHAWQSSLLFTVVFIVHLLFSWSTFLSWVFVIADLFLMGWLALRAYRDADTLDRFEVPVFGHIASSILDDE
ncbi:hypothetical protein F4775DRAFT_573521 [Biscogniauxia sp. FL1348]|nr:hypothetical protein F4775DRAFT_573521 [Biscogniauxia sp. FL1348]